MCISQYFQIQLVHPHRVLVEVFPLLEIVLHLPFFPHVKIGKIREGGGKEKKRKNRSKLFHVCFQETTMAVTVEH